MSYEWSELERIFQESLAMPAEKREEFIRSKTSGNKELEDTLMAMLANSGSAEKYFDNLQQEIARSLVENSAGPSLKEGDVIGKYKIKSLIGKGGMGEVYLAERNDGQFEQKVAIKSFSRANFNKASANSFRQEQQFLAKLNHGNIAHILDGGINDSGVPYIIMEYVEGIPIDEYIKKTGHLSENEILNLYLKICDTVQFAHNQLILHLDIKPNNILVSEGGAIKLLDFGISRKMGSTIDNDHFMASPYYAAPEQFLQNTVSVVTDVYQLGILLHVMLTGKFPFEKNADFKSRTIHLDQNEISEELQAIIKKCLAQATEDRYQSVNELSSDIKSYQRNFPVAVYSSAWSYKSAKYLQRNKATVSLLTLLFISMIVGTTLSLHQANLAKRNEQIAVKQKERAEQISSFLTNFFKSPNPRDENRLGKDFTIREFLKTGVDKAEDELAREPVLQLELLGIISDMYNNLGYQDETIALDEDLIPKYKKQFGDTSQRYHDSQLRLARNYSEIGKIDDADSIFQKLLKEDSQNYVDKANVLTEYGLFYQNLKGDFQTADSLLKNSISIYKEHSDTLRKEFADALSVLGTIQNRLTNFQKAESYYKRELDIKQKVITNDPVDIALTKSNLATVLLQTGKSKEALEMALSAAHVFEEKLGPKHLHTLHTYNNLSHIYLQNYKYEKAKKTASKCLNLYQQAFGENYETGYVFANHVFFDVKDGDFEKAQEHLNKAKEIFEKTLPPQHYLHAFVSINQALINIKTKKPEKALQNTKTAAQYLRSQIPKNHFLWGYLYQRKGAAYFELHNWKEAEHFLLDAYANLKASKGADNYNTQSVIKMISDLYKTEGEVEKSEQYYSLLNESYIKSKLYSDQKI